MTSKPKRPAPEAARPEALPRTLDGCRREIDRIDEAMIELLDRRARVARRVGEVKAARGDDYFDAGRHMTLLRGISRRGSGDFPPEGLRNVYREVLSVCLNLQAPQSIAYVGPEGGPAHIAARRAFGRAARFAPFATIDEVFVAVDRLEAHFGVVPIEDSAEGIMHATLDEFRKNDLSICAEVQLPVRHCLLGSGARSRVRKVRAEPAALSQCAHWLRENLPRAATARVPSAASALRAATRDKSIATIGSRLEAEIHGLKVLAEDIEDAKGALTRFIAVGHRPARPSEHDRTSIMLSLRDVPGSLAKLLQPFADHKINLKRIESRPSGERPWEYIFFLDLEGHVSRPEVQRVIDRLKRHCTYFRVLGSYPIDRPGASRTR